jgi:hypothetical protein
MKSVEYDFDCIGHEFCTRMRFEHQWKGTLMRVGAARVLGAVAIAGALGLAASGARAIPITLTAYADGVLIGSSDQNALGCVDNPDGVSAVCNAAGIEYGADYTAISVSITNLQIDSDPVVTGTTGITNSQAFAQHITLVYTLPVVAMPFGTVTGGRVSGTLTDQDANGASVSTAGAGTAFYTALLDGANWQQLYTDPASFAVLGTSTAIPNVTFGSPIPSLPGPAVASTIGIRLDFILSGFDSVSFTSNHVVNPVPEPGTAALVGLGLVFLAGRRRSN